MSRGLLRLVPSVLPVVVATDASVRWGVACSAYLSSFGGWTIVRRSINPQTSKQHTIMHAELMALDRAERHHHSRDLTLLTDSSSARDAVKRWSNGRDTPAAGDEEGIFVTFARRLGNREAPLTVQWVPSHAGHLLNEGADALARLGSRADRDGLSRDELIQRADGIADGFAAAVETELSR